MTAFWIGLVAVNLGCFLPLYLLNIREQPNPIAFLTEERFFNRKKLRLFYAKARFTDPFHINFDFTLALLLAAFFGLDGPWVVGVLTAVLAFSFIEIVYTSVMRAIFKRAPTLVSDISFAKVGLTIAHSVRWLILAGVALLVVAIVAGSFFASRALLAAAPVGHWSLLAAAALVIPPGVYHWRTFNYSEYLTRSVYSSLMHFWLNLKVSRRFRSVLHHDRGHFERFNDFTQVRFERRPDLLTVCIESYGSIVYDDPEVHAVVAPKLAELEATLERHGLRVASNFSSAPLFAGGSWMSYASFAYGIHIPDIWLYDVLFTQNDAFESYESMFHVLKRNGYRNMLLCPLGGVDAKYLDWGSINRCFQSDRNIEFDSLDYGGRRLSYFIQKETYCAPDEFALNRAYEQCRAEGDAPFSLFFCTLNSHFPYHSPAEAANDWRELNDPEYRHVLTQETCSTAKQRYATAIRYQFDFLLRFIDRHAGDDLLITLFGDHQPPMVAPESLGTKTPVHVIARDDRLIESLCADGFAPAIDPRHEAATPIRHEAFLSLMMRAMNATLGDDPGLALPRRPRGVDLFDA